MNGSGQDAAANPMPSQPLKIKLKSLGNRDEEDEVDIRELGKKSRMWAAAGNHYTPCEAAVDKLPPGNYRISINDRGIYFIKRQIETDSLLELPDSATQTILENMKVFWSREQKYRDYGFIWKRGILLYGPPGGGKTSTIELLAKTLVENMQGVVVHIDDPGVAIAGLEAFRFIENKTPLLIVIEDIDAIVQNRNESALLNLLDGEFQTDNVVVIATTNYPERVDNRIRNRPSRFDVVMKIELPSDAARRMFYERTHLRFREVLNDPTTSPEVKLETSKELDKWVSDTKGFSIAHLKELIIAVEVLGGEYNEQLKRLKTMMTNKLSSSQDEGGRLGFT